MLHAINDRLDKENVICIHHGILAAIKRSEIMSFAETWMELQAIILSRLTQEQKNQTPHILTYKWELNHENTRTLRGEQNTL